MAFRKGVVIQLGMVTVIADVNTAVEKESSLKTVCDGHQSVPHAPTAVKQKLNCPECGEVGYADVLKASIEADGFKIVTGEEVAATKDATVAATKKLISVTPHQTEEVQSKILPNGSVYYLTPSDNSQVPAYAMLHDTLARHTEIVMLGLWTPVSRPNLYRFGTFGEALTMTQQARVEDVKVEQPITMPLNAAVQAQMDTLLPMMVQPFDPANYADAYKAKLAELLASKDAVEGVEAERTKSAPRVPTMAGGTDLLATLQLMAEQAQAAL